MIEPTAAIENLTNYQQQADMDGVLVTVSRQALEEVLDYLRTPPASQSDEALVEAIARAGYEAEPCPPGLEPLFGWEAQKAQNGTDWLPFKRARAILPILTAHEADLRSEIERLQREKQTLFLDKIAAEAKGRREGNEEGWREGYCAGAWRPASILPPTGEQINAAWKFRQERLALTEKQP